MARLSPPCHHLSCLSRHLWTQSLPIACRDAAFCHLSCHLELHSGRAAPRSLPLCPCARVARAFTGPCHLLSELHFLCLTSEEGNRPPAPWFQLDFPQASPLDVYHALLFQVLFSQGMEESSRKLPIPFPHQWGRVCFWHLSQRDLLTS